MSRDPHTDFLGQPIAEGDRVVTYDSGQTSGLAWGTVTKLTPKMVSIQLNKRDKAKHRYGEEVIIMSEDQQQALAFKRMAQS
jgi:hypothetical protein